MDLDAPSPERALAVPGALVPKELPVRPPLVVAAALVATCGLYGLYWVYDLVARAGRAQLFSKPRPALAALLSALTLGLGVQLVLVAFARAARRLPLAANRDLTRAHEIAGFLPAMALLAIVIPPLALVTIPFAQLLANHLAAAARTTHADPNARERPTGF